MNKLSKLINILLLASASSVLLAADLTPNYNIGVFYYPGWKDNTVGNSSPTPWERIKSYPEKEPYLGWYKEGDVSVAQQHIQWMSDYGIDYVVYDVMYNMKVGGPMLEHAIQSYLQAPNHNLVKFSILWDNASSGTPKSTDEFVSMIGHYLSAYFTNEQYLKIDGKPVLFVMSQPELAAKAAVFGETQSSLYAKANKMAIDAGLPGIYFVGGSTGDVNDFGSKNGYNGFSAYNYHNGATTASAHGYLDFDLGYQRVWKWVASITQLPYIVPMTVGWDKRPWGGSKDTLHDNSISTPDEFEQHLLAAKKLMDSNKTKTLSTGVICCWNEFGEGSYIEPTKAKTFDYLTKVRKVFGQ